MPLTTGMPFRRKHRADAGLDADFVRQDWLLGLALSLPGLFIAVYLFAARVEAETMERERLVHQTRVVQDNLVRHLRAVDGTLASMRADLPHWRSHSDGLRRASNHLNALVGAVTGVRTLCLLDAGGKVIASSNAGMIGANFGDQAYFRRARQAPHVDTLYMAPPWAPTAANPALTAARMVSNPAGEFGGMVTATLDAEGFAALFTSARYAPDMRLALAHGDGTLFVMTPPHAQYIGANLARPGSLFTRHRASGQASSLFTGTMFTTDEYRLIAQETIQPAALRMDQPLILAVSRDMAALHAPWRRRALTLGLFFVAFAGVSVFSLRNHQQQRRRQQAAEAESAAARRTLDEGAAKLEARWRSALEATHQGVWDWDLARNTVYFSPVWKTTLGCADATEDDGPEEWIDRLHPDDRMSVHTALERHFAGRTPVFENIHRMRAANGEYRWMLGRGQVIERAADGRALRMIGTHVDVTETQEREKALHEAKAAAEAANIAKGRFLANMSHEIRTPLNAVLGLLHLLKRTGLAPRQAGYVTNAQVAARILLDLLNDILDFSKIEAGRLRVEDAPFRLDTLLDELCALLAMAVGDKPVTVRVTIDAAVPRALCGDALRLRQVLLNLGGNAVKFTDRGEVVLDVRMAQTGSEPDPAGALAIAFAVEDTGIGIPADRLPGIFDSFTQAESCTARQYGGSGLGLTISRQLVNLMGGELSAESRLGQGSRFAFVLPFTPAVLAANEQAPLPPGPAALSGLHVLLVEDNELNQQVARELLVMAGARVTLADEGAAAIAAITRGKEPFDVVLMDIQMPGMDGLETTRVLRRRFGVTLPIIAMTAHVEAADRAQCLAAGMNDHVGKPVDEVLLVATVLRHCRAALADPAGQSPASDKATTCSNAGMPGKTAACTTAAAPPPAGFHAPAGFDVASALARLGGKHHLFVSLVEKFSAGQQGMVERIRHDLRQNDRDSACRALHSLKGQAATLGADALREQAAAAERLVRMGAAADELDASLATLEQQLAADIANLHEIATRLGASLTKSPQH